MDRHGPSASQVGVAARARPSAQRGSELVDETGPNPAEVAEARKDVRLAPTPDPDRRVADVHSRGLHGRDLAQGQLQHEFLTSDEGLRAEEHLAGERTGHLGTSVSW